MKDNELDDLLRKKANDIDDSKFNFKIDVNEIKKKAEAKKKYNVLKISFASALAACLVLGALFFILKYQSPEEDNVTIQGNEENNINKDTKEIKAHEIIDTMIYLGDNVINSDEIQVLLLIAKINDVSNLGIIDEVPTTEVKAELIEKLYSAPGFQELGSNIDFELSTCLFNVNSIPEELKRINNKKYDKEGYIKVVSDYRLETVPYPEIGKTYIVSLTMAKDNYKVTKSSKYPFYEYDPETKKVKIGEEWQDIDFNYIVW